MKAIKLTKEHKSKLLEMCKTLFPEYHFQWGDYSSIYPIENVSLEYTLKNEFKVEGIHWFEFCITILSKKISENGLLIEFHDDINIIDFLYKEFKQIKK